MSRGARHAVVVTNVRCNQACTYCSARAPTDDLRFIAAAAVERRIRVAVEAGATEITLTGGEPTMRSDLEALVATVRAAGAEQVGIETNATLIDASRARRLREAGLTRARVNLPCWGEALDAITRDPGGFERARVGLEALAAAGVTIDVAAAVVRSTLPHLPSLPARVAESFRGSVRGIAVLVPVEAPDARELVSYEEAAAAVRALVAEAWKAAVPVSFHPALGIPACMLEPAVRDRLASLYSLSTGARRLAGHAEIQECRACAIADRCPGVPDAYLTRRGLPRVYPMDERSRRRLTMSRPAHEQIERELVARSVRADGEGRPVGESVIRLNFHCNQACSFCFVSTQLPPPRPEAIERAIVEAARRGDCVALSGGEPTLHAGIIEFIRLARSASRLPVTLQTNAVRLDDAELVTALAKAGLGHAFVSLHGATAPVAEAVTNAPGTFRRTLAGLDNLLRASVPVTVNFVLCATNAHEMPAAVELAAERWPGALFNVSFVAASTDAVPRDPALIPRYRDVMPHIRASLECGRRSGVRVIGFESMCGLPLCLVPEGFDPAALFEIPLEFDRSDFVKAEGCAACRHDRQCWGIRRTYADLHGVSELRPVASR